MVITRAARMGIMVLVLSSPLSSQPVRDRGDSVTVQLIDVDLRTAVAALAPYLDRPVVFGAVPASRITIQTPTPIPRAAVTRLLGGAVAAQNLDLALDTTAGLYRIQPHQATPIPPQPSNSVGMTTSLNGGMQLFVLHLNHARAADVAATVNALYGRSSALGEPGATAHEGGTLASQLLRNQLSVSGAASGTAPVDAPSAGAGAQGFSGETTIVPDPRTNSLLIRANAPDFSLIRTAVTELDVRPLQVLIEVLIAEISKNANWSFGVSTTVPQQTIKGTSVGIGGTIAGLGTGALALNVMKSTGFMINASLALAAQRGEARILSRPVVLAQNNEEAEILVGSQQPFVQVSQTQVGAIAQNQVVQYQDVGTKLTVRPTISADGYVQLEVTQEVNEATGQVSFNAPVISTRVVKTHLMVRDSQTVVLGGLSNREKDRNSSGVPILSSIPIIGGLFGQTSRTSTDVEFFLFLTPHIVRSDDEAADVTTPYRDSLGTRQP